MKLVSLADVKAFLEKTDTEHDQLLTNLIEQVSARIERALNRNLTKAERTEYFDKGESVYLLSAYPVDEAADFTVILDGESQTKDEDFYLDPEKGLIEFAYGTGDYKPRALVVTYTGGYAEDVNGVLQVPKDLKRACLLQVAFEFGRRRDLGLRAVNVGDGSINVYEPARFLPEVREILDLHMRVAL